MSALSSSPSKLFHARLLAGAAIGCLVFAAVSSMDAEARAHHRKAAPAASSAASSDSASSAPASADSSATASDSRVDANSMNLVKGAGKAIADKDNTAVRTPTIDDAPKGDYERVAWCHGILSGDMELADIINPLEPTDQNIQMIGRSYLRAYEAALTLSGQGKTETAHTLAEKARQKGYDGWAAARKAEIHKAAWAYDSWQLPGDCEHAAVRLSGHPNLFAELATDDEVKAINDAFNSGGPHKYEELPKPKLTAQNTAPDADGPISTNRLAIRAKEAAALPKTDAPAATASASSSSASGK